MFSSVISAIENCGVIVHSNDSLINRRESLPPLLCVTQWGRRARDGPGGSGGEQTCEVPQRQKKKRKKRETPVDAAGRSVFVTRAELQIQSGLICSVSEWVPLSRCWNMMVPPTLTPRGCE